METHLQKLYIVVTRFSFEHVIKESNKLEIYLIYALYINFNIRFSRGNCNIDP